MTISRGRTRYDSASAFVRPPAFSIFFRPVLALLFRDTPPSSSDARWWIAFTCVLVSSTSAFRRAARPSIALSTIAPSEAAKSSSASSAKARASTSAFAFVSSVRRYVFSPSV